jgi:hypothetical protein
MKKENLKYKTKIHYRLLSLLISIFIVYKILKGFQSDSLSIIANILYIIGLILFIFEFLKNEKYILNDSELVYEKRLCGFLLKKIKIKLKKIRNIDYDADYKHFRFFSYHWTIWYKYNENLLYYKLISFGIENLDDLIDNLSDRTGLKINE